MLPGKCPINADTLEIVGTCEFAFLILLCSPSSGWMGMWMWMYLTFGWKERKNRRWDDCWELSCDADRSNVTCSVVCGYRHRPSVITMGHCMELEDETKRAAYRGDWT